MVSIAAFQAVDPGSISGWRIFSFSYLFFITISIFFACIFIWSEKNFYILDTPFSRAIHLFSIDFICPLNHFTLEFPICYRKKDQTNSDILEEENACKYIGRFNGLAIGNKIMVSRVENVLLKPVGPKVHFCYMTTEKTKKRTSFVGLTVYKTVLTL